MYGQTEAAPRISYVPPHRLPEKIGSIGLAIPGGAVDIDPSSGELVYSGPNVMMGYALSRDDLRKPDECHGVLGSGDLGRRDEEGFVYLTGRLKRFVKLSGSRVSLDEVETALSKTFAVKPFSLARLISLQSCSRPMPQSATTGARRASRAFQRVSGLSVSLSKIISATRKR